MRRTMLMSALLAAGLLGSVGASPAAASPPGEAGLRAANASEVAGMMAGDTRALGRLWADSYVVTIPLNKLVTKADILGMVGIGTLRFSSYQRNIEYLRLNGDTAIVAGVETVGWAGRMPLAGKTSRLRFTSVWRRTSDGWREIARHSNTIPER